MDTKQAPTTVKEVGIHISYISKTVEELAKRFEQVTHVYVTKEESAILDSRIKALEQGNVELVALTEQLRGAIKLLKGLMAFLVAIGTVGLWWATK